MVMKYFSATGEHIVRVNDSHRAENQTLAGRIQLTPGSITPSQPYVCEHIPVCALPHCWVVRKCLLTHLGEISPHHCPCTPHAGVVVHP